LKEDPRFADAYLGEGEIYLKNRNVVPALVRFNEALAIYKSRGEKFFIGRAYYNIAEAYFLQGDYGNSSVNYQKALKMRTANDMNIPLIYSRLSEIASKDGLLKTAVKFAEKAVKENKKFGNKYVQTALLTKLAVLYKETNRLGLAKETFRKAVKISKETGYPQLDELYKTGIELQDKK